MARQIDLQHAQSLHALSKYSEDRVLKDIAESDWHYKDLEQLERVIQCLQDKNNEISYKDHLISELLTIINGIAPEKINNALERLILDIHLEVDIWESRIKLENNKNFNERAAKKKHIETLKSISKKYIEDYGRITASKEQD